MLIEQFKQLFDLSRKQNKYWLFILKLLDALLFAPESSLAHEYS